MSQWSSVLQNFEAKSPITPPLSRLTTANRVSFQRIAPRKSPSTPLAHELLRSMSKSFQMSTHIVCFIGGMKTIITRTCPPAVIELRYCDPFPLFAHFNDGGRGCG